MAERMQDQSQTAVRPTGAGASAPVPASRRNPDTVVRQAPIQVATHNSSDFDGDAPPQPPPTAPKPSKEKKSKKHRDRSKDKKERHRSKEKDIEPELPQQPSPTPQVQPSLPPQPQPRSTAVIPPPVPAPRIYAAPQPQPPPPTVQTEQLPAQPQQPRSSSLPRDTQPTLPRTVPGPVTSTGSSTLGPQQPTKPQQSKSFHGTTAASLSAAGVPSSDALVDNYGPGLVGIVNHGNSCYMNAVLQCISHVDPLAHYFSSDLYLTDLFAGTVDKKGRPIPHEYRTELTDAFGQLLKSLWFGTYQPILSDNLRQIVARTKPDLALREQQDAHEFMTVLLESLHDELNGYKRIPKIKQKPPLPPSANSDSATFSDDHAQRNRSVVYQLFYGYQRSRLTCPGCAFTTSNAEPITCLSLPIPVGTTRALTIVLADPRGRQTRFGLEVAADGSVRELRRSLATRWQLEQPRNLLICELGPGGFKRTFRDSDSTALLCELGEGCGLYGIQLPDPMMDEGDDSDSSDSEPVYRPEGLAGPGSRPIEEDLSYIRLVSVHCERTRSGELRRFTGPLHTQLQVHCSHAELKEALLTELEAAGDLPRIANKRDVYVELRLVDGPPQTSVLQQNQRSPPLVGPAVDRALNFNLADHGPRHLKLTVVWGVAERKRYADAYVDEVEPDVSLRTAEAQQQDKPVSLHDCLTEYMAGPPASWMCPNCRRMQHAEQVTRLWNCPDVLVIQLKRFQLAGQRKTKVAAFVQFPIESLDLTEFMDEENLGRLNPYSLSATGRPPQSATPADYTFDLMGVVNHSGGLYSGHYTAYTLSPSDRQWWRFNDGQVEALSDMTAVSSSDAYLLFYQRRTLRAIFVNGAHWSSAIAQQQMYEHQMSQQLQSMQAPTLQSQPQFQSFNPAPNEAGPLDDFGDGGVELRRPLRPQANLPINLIPTFAPPPPPPPPPQQVLISIDETASGRTVKTGRARIHVPDSKKRQGKWVWRGGVKVWDGPDPPPPPDQPAAPGDQPVE